ncbi:hypothetical protein P4S72_19625 [Vibrio sp. PP-XX7]
MGNLGFAPMTSDIRFINLSQKPGKMLNFILKRLAMLLPMLSCRIGCHFTAAIKRKRPRNGLPAVVESPANPGTLTEVRHQLGLDQHYPSVLAMV